jgi:acyl dehydratase
MKAGDALPSLERTIRLTDMVAYAGATWDWHRLHYDAEYVASAGLPKPVVDGQMLGALMAEHIMDALGPTAFITNLGFRLKAMVFAEDTVRVEGELTAIESGYAVVAQRVSAGERLAAEGRARVRL